MEAKICYGISPDHGRSSVYLLLTTAFDWWVKPWAHFCHLSVGPCLMWSLMFKVCVMKYPTPHLRAYHCKPHSMRLLYVNLTAGNAKWTLQTHCRAPWRPVGSVWFHVKVMARLVSSDVKGIRKFSKWQNLANFFPFFHFCEDLPKVKLPFPKTLNFCC